ncbi:MAG: AsmA family protein [Candidatus Omnitrophota bacterium]
MFILPKLSASVRKTLFILAAVFLLFSAGLFYVNKVLLPIQAKTFILKLAQDNLKRGVTFDTLQYNPIRGFVITQLVIADKNDPSKIFLKAESASANILWPALLKKKIIIPSVEINKPEIWMTRTVTHQWNFNDLIPDPAAAPTSGSPAAADLAITGLNITNGRVILTDTTSEFSETFLVPLIRGALSLDGVITIAGTIAIPSGEGRIAFDGRIRLGDKSCRGTIKAANILLERYLRFLPEPLPVNIQSLTIKDTSITATFEKETITLSGSLHLPETAITLADKTKLLGNITLSGISARKDQDGIALEGLLHTEALAIDTPAGVTLRLNTLNTTHFKASLKGPELRAATDLDAKAIDITLADGQKFTTDLSIRALELTQNALTWSARANANAAGLSAALNNSRSISGSISLNNITITGDIGTIRAQADIAADQIKLASPEGTLTTNILLPQTRLSLVNGRVESALRASFQKLDAAIQGITVKGNTSLSAHIILDPRAATPLTYTGMLRITGLSAENVPSAGSVNNIRGTLTFETNRAQTKQLSLTALSTPVHLSGSIIDLAALRVNIKASAEALDLAGAAGCIPNIIKEYAVTLGGTAAIDASFDGFLSRLQEGNFSGQATLKDVHAASGKFQQEISGLNGTFNYSAPSLFWKDLTVNYQGKTWTSHGYMQDFTSPFIKASIKTDNLNADIEARKKGDAVNIDTLTGAFFSSNFNIKGAILLPPGKSPEVDLGSEIKLVLRELPQMLPPEQAKQIEALKLAGILKIKANIKGAPQQWQSLASTLSIETPEMVLMGYKINDLVLNASQKDNKITPLTINGALYGGIFQTSTSIELKEKDFPFETTAKLENVNLELLKKDTPLKQQQLSGQLGATASLKGACLDIRHVTGNASIKISQGYLWALDILSNVLSILSSSFQGGDMIVTDASADFKIIDQKVMTNNLSLKSATVTLAGEGWVDFDQNIDLNISPSLTPNVGGATVPAIINPTADIVNIRVCNTLTAPKFEHNITAPAIIKKTLENTVGNILKIFE